MEYNSVDEWVLQHDAAHPQSFAVSVFLGESGELEIDGIVRVDGVIFI